jgi:hypothetical protein
LILLIQHRKASFVGDFNEDPSVSANIRYFFPQGCKGIDVLIDNSSRLRSLASSPYMHIRLPVTLKPLNVLSDVYEPPISSSYPLPGPPHIYAPNQIHVSAVKPPSVYLPPTQTTTTVAITEATTETPNIYLPPVKPEDPANVYLPPVKPQDPSNIYLPPVETSSSAPPTLITEIIPPVIPDEPSCGASLTCCEEASPGKFVIPIPLKSSGCCPLVAKLILPISGFDEDSIRKLTQSVGEKLDAKQLLANVLSNLVK